MAVKASIQLYNPEDVPLELEVESLRTSIRDRVTDAIPERKFVVPAHNDRVFVDSIPVNITLKPEQDRINCFVDWVFLYREQGSTGARSPYCIRGNLVSVRLNGRWESRWTPVESNDVEWPMDELDGEVTEDEHGAHGRPKA